MAAFVYQCPTTGYKVQGHVEKEDVVAADPTCSDDVYEPVTCTLCQRIHLVNPKTGKVLGG